MLSRPQRELKEAQLRSYVNQSPWRNVDQGDFTWASLSNFWCVHGKYLARQDENKSDFNKLLGRDERKTCNYCGSVHDPPKTCPKTNRYPRRFSEKLTNKNLTEQWIAGDRQESKKVFSFKNPPRTFGFIKPGLVEFDDMKRRLKVAWPGLKDNDILRGHEILDCLIGVPEGSP
jgi:CRISPR-associated protein Cmr1